MNDVRSLDHQYLLFAAGTNAVFAQHPHIEPLRYFIFKELLVKRSSVGWRDSAKHWLRPLVRRGHSNGSLNRADVLIWVETDRKEICDASIPVERELASRGISVRLVSFRDRPEVTHPSAVNFQFPASVVLPAWVKNAWHDLCDVLPDLRCPLLEKHFAYSCASIGALLRELDRVLDRVKPKAVILSSTQQPGGSSLAVTSRSQGISTLLLQHGITQPFYIPLLTDYMLTWGETSTESLFRLGVSRKRLTAVGSPRHDAMSPSTDGTSRKKFLRALCLADRPTFVFFSNGNDLLRNGQAPMECATWLEETAARHSNRINIVVRLHPNEDGSLYKDCSHLSITKHLPELPLVLDGCDWVGSLCSTVLYEALLYNKPVWQFYADEWPELADNWKEGLALRIASKSQFGEMTSLMINEGSDGVNYGRLADRVFANHGRATQAVCDFVEDCLQNRQTANAPTSEYLPNVSSTLDFRFS